MESLEDIFVYPADFGWSDLGTWGSLYSRHSKDLRNNVVVGKNISIYKSDNCMVFSNQEKKVVVIGMQDCIVAEHDNQLLVCKMQDEQLIKNFSE